MSSRLYRLGLWVAGNARRVLLIGLAILVLVLGAAAGLGGQLKDDVSIPGTEGQAGLDALHKRFPELSGTSAQLLFMAPKGESISAHRQEVEEVVRSAKLVPDVSAATDPFDPQTSSVSADGRAALVLVQFDRTTAQLPKDTADVLKHTAHVPPGSDVTVHVGGDLYANSTVHVSITEAIGILVAFLVLVMTFGSMVAAGLPILTAIMGVGGAMGAILSVAAFTTVNSTTPSLALMIGLAVGIDYALFITARHRSQLADGVALAESIGRSLATAGSAVIFAGVTVIIALCGLVVAQIPFLTVMGFAAAFAVLVAVVIALTVVPALLMLAGDRLRPRPTRTSRNKAAAQRTGRTLGSRWVSFVTRAPAATVAIALVVIGTLAYPALDLKLGLNDNGDAAPGSIQRTTYDLVEQEFGAGYNSPLLITADIIDTNDPIGTTNALARKLATYPGVSRVGLATPNHGADLGIVQVIPTSSQNDATTSRLVRAIRSDRASLENQFGIQNLRVTGQTAVAIDVSQQLSQAVLPFAMVVVGLSLVLLMIVFRSVAVPIKASVGYLLSVAASMGVVAAVFDWGWFARTLDVAKIGPVISFFPIILMGVLFGLAMDYEVFLVSRMREDYVHGSSAKAAVRSGFAGSARVVTAAAVIMIAVFAAFVPEGDAILKPIALGLAAGVLVDAFLVRMTFVPAVLTMLGDKAWWLPTWLDQRLPALDVEGAALEHHIEHDEWTRTHGPARVRAEGLHTSDGSTALELVLRAGEAAVLVDEDAVSRHALLASLTGRLRASGRLVVLDRVLPEEAATVRSKVPFQVGWVGSVPLPLIVADFPRGVPSVERARANELVRKTTALVIGVPVDDPDLLPSARRIYRDRTAPAAGSQPNPDDVYSAQESVR